MILRSLRYRGVNIMSDVSFECLEMRWQYNYIPIFYLIVALINQDWKLQSMLAWHRLNLHCTMNCKPNPRNIIQWNREQPLPRNTIPLKKLEFSKHHIPVFLIKISPHFLIYRWLSFQFVHIHEYIKKDIFSQNLSNEKI